MTIQRIKEIAYKLIGNNQDDYGIKDDKEKLIYILAFNDGVNAFVRELEIELNKEDEKDTQTEELKDGRSNQSIVESMSQNTQEGYSRSSVGYSKVIVKTKKELYEKTKGKTLVFLTAKGGAHNLEPSYEIRINNICISNYVKGSVYDALISGIIKAIEQLPDETDVAVVCGSSIGFAKYFRGKGVYYDQIDRLMDLVSAKSDTITEVFWKDGVSKISEIIKQ